MMVENFPLLMICLQITSSITASADIPEPRTEISAKRARLTASRRSRSETLKSDDCKTKHTAEKKIKRKEPGAGSQEVNITGGINRLAPNCETTVKKLCDENDISKQGPITRIDVKLRECRLHCYSNGGTHVSSMHLPDTMPCALGATCQGGNCVCEACNQIPPRPPR